MAGADGKYGVGGGGRFEGESGAELLEKKGQRLFTVSPVGERGGGRGNETEGKGIFCEKRMTMGVYVHRLFGVTPCVSSDARGGCFLLR